MEESQHILRGRNLIEELKSHVVATFSQDPRGAFDAEGLGNSEIERLAGLEVPLE